MNFRLLICIVVIFQLSTSLNAQNHVVSGTVFSDKTGRGIGGVSVCSGKAGVQTDTKGRYTITVSEGDTLLFSRYGFRARPQITGEEDTMNVVLFTHKIAQPYGTADEEGFIGSAVVIPADFWAYRSFTNPLQALQGAGTGIQTTLPAGAPGSAPGIRLRGTSYSGRISQPMSDLPESTIEPLYVVDGMEFTGKLSDLNPDDIESITALKDAGSLALYGSRAYNGVVMITTRTGIREKSAFTFGMEFGTAVNGVPSYNTVSPAEYYELSWQIYRNNMAYGLDRVPLEVAGQIASGLLPRGSNGMQIYNNKAYYPDVVQLLGNYNAFNVPDSELIGLDGKLNPRAELRYPQKELNWQDQVFRKGSRNEYRMAYSTVMGKLDVMASLNYLREEGWAHRSLLERYTGRLNLGYQITRWLKTGLHLNVAQSAIEYATTGSAYANPFSFARNIGAIFPVHLLDPKTGEVVYDNEGNKIYDTGNYRDTDYGYFRNFRDGIHPMVSNEQISDHTDRSLYSSRAFMSVSPLSWLRLDFNAGKQIIESKWDKEDNNPEWKTKGWTKSRNADYTINQTLTVFKNLHKAEFSLIAGHESFVYRGKSSGEEFTWSRLSASFEPTGNSFFSFKQDWDSYFTKAHAVFFRKYFLEGVYRKDKLIRYNESKSWSLGGSWKLSRENFANVGSVDDLTLYASYGQLLPSYDASFRLYFPFFTKRPFTAGLRFSLWNERFSGKLEYFSIELKDIIDTQYTFPLASSGQPVIPKTSVGERKNTGTELSLSSVLLKGRRLSWSVAANLTFQNDRITAMPALLPEVIRGDFKLQKGVSVYAYYTRTFYGVDPQTGAVLFEGVNKYDPVNPEIQIRESGGKRDTVTTNVHLARRTLVGKSALAKGYGSFTNSLRYGNFDLDMMVTCQFGGWAMDGSYMTPLPETGINFHKDLLKAWQKPGDITDIPLLTANTATGFSASSTRWLIRSDYLNLAAIKLSYRIPEKALPSMRLTLFANAENVCFLTRRKGMNPLNSFEGIAESKTYNFARRFNLGLNLKL